LQDDEDALLKAAIEESRHNDDRCLNEALLNGFTLAQAREAQS